MQMTDNPEKEMPSLIPGPGRQDDARRELVRAWRKREEGNWPHADEGLLWAASVMAWHFYADGEKGE